MVKGHWVGRGEKKVFDPSRLFRLDAVTIETGVLPLDIVLGSGDGKALGGFSRGDLIELSSPSGNGKSTLALSIVKNFLLKGMRCAYFDVERGVKRSMLKSMGIEERVSGTLGSDFLLLSPETFDDLEELFDAHVLCG